MLTFLFWNVVGKPLEETIARLVHRHDVDVLMLAECTTIVGTMLSTLNRETTDDEFASMFLAEPALPIYVRFGRSLLKPVEDTGRLTVRELTIPGAEPILLALTHCPSKLWASADSQREHLIILADRIRNIETRMGHTRTILVGDFNANPFEPGMIGAKGLHAVMTRDREMRGSRTVEGSKWPFFYNPMWGRFGDTSDGPPGTYHYSGGGFVNYFWHMFDQVLIRPSLLDRFRAEYLEILTGDGAGSFLIERSGDRGTSPRGTLGVPDVARFSDHLPLLFRLTL